VCGMTDVIARTTNDADRVTGRRRDHTKKQDDPQKSTWWMPWRNRPMKDVATRRNAPGRRWQPAIRRCPNGATPLGDTRDLPLAGGNRGN
jgi:hypothetical protein